MKILILRLTRIKNLSILMNETHIKRIKKRSHEALLEEIDEIFKLLEVKK